MQWLAVNVHNSFVGHAIRLAQAVGREGSPLVCGCVWVWGVVVQVVSQDGHVQSRQDKGTR